MPEDSAAHAARLMYGDGQLHSTRVRASSA